MLAVFCPHCQHQLHIRPEHAGRRVQCPACKETLTPHATLPPPPASEVGTASSDWGIPYDSRASQPPAVPGEPPSTAFPFLGPPQAAGELGTLGGYRVVRLLGAGGMGCVFEAIDPNLGRRVALKVLNADTAAHPQGRTRFLREARAAAAVQHERVVAIHQVGEDGGWPFFVMPLLEGETLEARLGRQARLPVSEVLRIGGEVAEGLAAAHAKGLIHRDVKPANVWLEAPDGRVKILDFGLARAETSGTRVTRLGAVLGTPGFIAPEQAGGTAEARTDLFALGCVLFLMLTGELPFGSDGVQPVRASAAAMPPSPRERNPKVPPALAALVTELLVRLPEGRPESARAVVERLRTLADKPAAVRPPAPTPTPSEDSPEEAPAASGWREWMLGLGLLAVVCALVVVGVVLLTKGPRDTPKERGTSRDATSPQDATALKKKREYEGLLVSGRNALRNERYDDALQAADAALQRFPGDEVARALQKDARTAQDNAAARLRARAQKGQTFTNSVGMEFRKS